MSRKKIAIIREEKTPEDNRVAITPQQAARIKREYPDIEILCQRSTVRCFSDEDYARCGVRVVDDVSDADILFGVKEVPEASLVADKTYLFFSHTIKKQPYNRNLLQTALTKKIRLIDYECLVDEHGLRIIAFGRWAGIVGAYNAIYTYGQKYSAFSMKRAYECEGLESVFSELRDIKLPPVKILITGNGRVAKGALEVMQAASIKRVDIESFLFQQFDQPVYCQIDADVYTKRKDGLPFSFEHFFKHPEAYKSNFKTFNKVTDMLIMAAFWNPKAPRLFELSECADPTFKIRLIADITCDINGSVPTTIRPTTIESPVYDIDRYKFMEKEAFSDEENISVMAVDNLPNELAKDASTSFGEVLIGQVLPLLLDQPDDEVLKQATIAQNGALTQSFEYLADYVNDKSS